MERRRRAAFVAGLGFAVALGAAGAEPAAGPEAAGDAAAARELFERNLEAIRQRDREAYLSCYLESEELVRTGPEGFSLGFQGLAASAGEGWPDVFEAQDLRLTPVLRGAVYGTYRYRVRYGADEVQGLSERWFVDTDDGWRIAVTTAFPAPPGTPPPPRALVGATLVDGTGAPPVHDAVVLLREGRIECAGPRAACPVPAGVGTVDLAGHWITPGLIDAHVHLSQTGWLDGRPDFIDVRDRYPYPQVVAELQARPEGFLRSHLCSGITAAFDVGGYPWTWELRQRAAADTGSPRLAAAGPLLSTVDHWVNLPGERQFLYLADPEAAREGVRYLAARGTDAVKIWFLAAGRRPFEEAAAAVRAAAAAAAGAGLPLIVHATGLREARVAVEAGAHLLVHSVWDQPVDGGFIELLRRRGTIYCPTLTVLEGYRRAAAASLAGEAPRIDDPNGCVDARTRAKVAATAAVPSGLGSGEVAARAERTAERRRLAERNLRALAAAGVAIATGTDAGNPLTLHGPAIYGEMEAMQAAGLAPMEVLVATTLGGARAMGREEEIGTVEAGKAADLLIVAADPTADIANLRQARYVVRGGVLRSIAELSAAERGAAGGGR